MKKYIYTIALAISLIGLSSCEGFLDVNDNPNQAVSSTPDLVIAAALNNTAARLAHHEVGAFWVGQWSPTGSVSGFNEQKTYDITTNFLNGTWIGIYDNLEDYLYVEQNAANRKSLSGIAKVMKAYNYQLLVDMYNNVPYSDALKGTASIRPKYDEGQAIYDNLITVLDDAIVDLTVPVSGDNPSAGSADIYFGGNITKWRKFANTLKLRILLRQINVAGKESYIKEQIAKIAAEGSGFLGADENVLSNPGYTKSSGKMNQFYESYGFTAADKKAGNRDFYCYSKFFVDNMKSTNDMARLARLATTATAAPYTGQYRGPEFGEGNDDYLATKVSLFGPAIADPPKALGGTNDNGYARAMVVMTAAESFFLQAEAVQRGYLSGDAKTLFESGITESFKLLGVADASTAASDYYNQSISNVSWNSSSDKIEAIVYQKWVALTSYNGFEAWCEYRRTGVPDVPLSTRAIGIQQPVRILYPASEYSTNAANVKEQGAISQFTSKIFWIK
ncbi:SusD/RagB family nutrient-binding outer membrane lipoprotein [Cytophagaceae bacterium YF14B1]|uniref:SusD/RagB family nutrient-binding outer membrane lipoprotein n=1 Tax=Xanthocytophaga flava TaxID=3048013 RepID=A0AAE3QIR6_9BACT|nr:SusD/RagB family nutrient-binding outer membrane lipoprotein [Xanthocytophaga flavus]MDJ1480067.1 SusD/RagB family nutrient-binding outer membrane lipoprotein [Xanthocytophaga flavus]